jgi:hypothetical protein
VIGPQRRPAPAVLPTAADLMAELVRRADTAIEQARQAEARAAAAETDLRAADLEVELYRQLRRRVLRWLAAGHVPEADQQDARHLCEHPTLAARARGGGRR